MIQGYTELVLNMLTQVQIVDILDHNCNLTAYIVIWCYMINNGNDAH